MGLTADGTAGDGGRTAERMSADRGWLATKMTLSSPNKGSRMLVPVSGDRFKVVHDELGSGRISAIQGTPLEYTLNGLGHSEPTASQGSEKGENAHRNTPAQPVRIFMADQIIEHEPEP